MFRIIVSLVALVATPFSISAQNILKDPDVYEREFQFMEKRMKDVGGLPDVAEKLAKARLLPAKAKEAAEEQVRISDLFWGRTKKEPLAVPPELKTLPYAKKLAWYHAEFGKVKKSFEYTRAMITQFVDSTWELEKLLMEMDEALHKKDRSGRRVGYHCYFTKDMINLYWANSWSDRDLTSFSRDYTRACDSAFEVVLTDAERLVFANKVDASALEDVDKMIVAGKKDQKKFEECFQKLVPLFDQDKDIQWWKLTRFCLEQGYLTPVPYMKGVRIRWEAESTKLFATVDATLWEHDGKEFQFATARGFSLMYFNRKKGAVPEKAEEGNTLYFNYPGGPAVYSDAGNLGLVDNYYPEPAKRVEITRKK